MHVNTYIYNTPKVALLVLILVKKLTSVRVVKCNTVMQFKMQWKPLNLLSEKEKKRAEAFEQLRINALDQQRTEILSELVSVCRCTMSMCVCLSVLWQINFDFFFFLMTSNKRRNSILALILSGVKP